MTVVALFIGLCCIGLIVLGLLADAIDPYGDERRDALRRNR